MMPLIDNIMQGDLRETTFELGYDMIQLMKLFLSKKRLAFLINLLSNTYQIESNTESYVHLENPEQDQTTIAKIFLRLTQEEFNIFNIKTKPTAPAVTRSFIYINNPTKFLNYLLDLISKLEDSADPTKRSLLHAFIPVVQNQSPSPKQIRSRLDRIETTGEHQFNTLDLYKSLIPNLSEIVGVANENGTSLEDMDLTEIYNEIIKQLKILLQTVDPNNEA